LFGEPTDYVAIYLGKVSMLNVRGVIELELADGRVIHGRYQNDIAEKIRSIHLGDQLMCTVGRNEEIISY
jgi:CRISPR/Cas system-associated exonuclease Cas4 (RecB family)